MTSIHVAVGVIRRGNAVLIARRPDHAHQGGLLEFPGGKVEPGERVQDALVREIAEETGLAITADSLRPVIGIRHDYGDKHVFLDVWSTTDVMGEPRGLEGQWIGWREIQTLNEQDFPAANHGIIRALTLPDFYAVSGAFDSVAEALERLTRQLDWHRPTQLLLRAPWLGRAEYLEFADAALALCQARQVRLILHGEPDVLSTVPAHGIHVPWRVAADMSARPVPASCDFAVSCHDRAELAHAAALGADFITLSPVRPTSSHPGASALGWSGFRRLAELAPMPAYALGGVTRGDIDEAVQHGAQGIAGISNWW